MITNLTDREKFCILAYLLGCGDIDTAYLCSRKTPSKSKNAESNHVMALRWRNSDEVALYIEKELHYKKRRNPDGTIDFLPLEPLVREDGDVVWVLPE